MEIKVDLHTHTSVSQHAYSTVKENAASAAENGLEAFAITDHAPGMFDGATEWHFSCLKLVPRYVCGITVLRGAECSFTDEDAGIDLADRVLDMLDVVIASVHTPAYCPQSAEEHTKMLLKAMENPKIDILGHIDRVKCGADFDLIAKTAKEKGKLIEMNNHSLNYAGVDKTFEYTRALAEACKKYNTPVVVTSDAHFCDAVGNFDAMLKFFEEIGIDESIVINTSLEKFLDYMKDKKNIIL